MNQCLICERPALTFKMSGGEESKGSMFFLLGKVLQVPDHLLLKFSEGSSSSSSPVGICGSCQTVVKECEAVHEQLVKVKRQWNDCKMKVINKIKDTATPRSTVTKIEGQGQPVNEEKGLREETRRFIMSRVYPAAVAPGKGQKVITAPRPLPPAPLLSCLFCGATFLHESNLETHMNSDIKEKPYICRECGWEFGTPDKLRRHKVERHLQRPFQCPQCHKGFGRKYHLERHLETHGEINELPWKCGVCEKAFAQKNNLERHEVVHTKEKRFECGACGKKFTQGQNLARHKKIYNH